MERKYFFSLGLILLGILITAKLSAQNSGKIVGTVLDRDTRTPLPGANVILEGTMLGAATDLDGKFIIMKVPPSRYTLIVNFIGYQKIILQNVQVLTDLTTTANFELKPEVIAGDDVLDAIYHRLFNDLLAYMMEDARVIRRATGVLFAAKHLERFGDHAMNVAEMVIYMVKGTDVRHPHSRGDEAAAK